LDIRYVDNEHGFPGSTQFPLYGRETDQTIDVAGTFDLDNAAVTLFYDYGNTDYVDSIMDKALVVRSDQFGALVARHDTLQGAIVDFGASGYLTALDGGHYLPTRLSEGDIWARGRINSGRFFVQAGGLLGMGNYHDAFFCPKAEFGVKIVESMDLRAAFSRDVRLPSDFEKWAPFDSSIPYFSVAGNEWLEPEYCLAGEIGLRGERLMLNLYRLYFTDLIAVHVENGYNPFYMNVKSWEANGVEGHLSYPIRIYSSDSGAVTELSFTGSFNALMSGDSLLYVPPQQARAGLSIKRSTDRFSFGIALRADFSGARHDMYGAEHDGFSVYSLAALVKFLSLSCVVRLNNVFDESYTSIPYYPMAPRNYDVSVKWEFWD